MAITSSASQRSAIAARPRVSRKPWGAIFLFIAPAIIVYTIFVLYPLLATFYYSLHQIAPAGGKVVTTFVGLANYQALFQDTIFFQAAKNTLLWGAAGPLFEMVIAITLAMVVYFRVPLHRFYRVAWFTPILVSGVIVGLVFRWIFNYDWGILNVGLRAIGLDLLALNWLGRRDTPIWAVIFVHFWATFGYSFILLLAGLSAIPNELLEAAYIDGASRPQAIWHVLLPLKTHRHHGAHPFFYGQDARIPRGMGTDQRRANAFLRNRRHVCTEAGFWVEFDRSRLPFRNLRRLVRANGDRGWHHQSLASIQS